MARRGCFVIFWYFDNFLITWKYKISSTIIYFPYLQSKPMISFIERQWFVEINHYDIPWNLFSLTSNSGSDRNE
jgi:hypothetical protein